ncbi:MAG: cytochrome c, partial [Nitrospirales bacterium]|nr:cytochrome c [Nitrospirales bacterium]
MMDCLRALTLASLLVLFLSPCSFGEETDAAARGKQLFRQKCASCHTIQGGGARGVGPDLKGVTTRRERKWLIDFIVYTDRMLASDPLAQQLLKEHGNFPMPTMGLTRAEGVAIVEYLERLDEGQGEKEAPLPPSAGKEVSKEGPGDAARGRALFLGTIPFQKGGPPCFSCHTAAGDAPLGGGTLGPGLTDIYTRYGEEGLSAMLASLATPTMQPLYGERP